MKALYRILKISAYNTEYLAGNRSPTVYLWSYKENDDSMVISSQWPSQNSSGEKDCILCSTFAVWSVNVSWWVDKWLNINYLWLFGKASQLSWQWLGHWLACSLDWQLPIPWRTAHASLSLPKGKFYFSKFHLLHLNQWKQSPLSNALCFHLIHQGLAWHPGLPQYSLLFPFWAPVDPSKIQPTQEKSSQKLNNISS